MSTKLAVKIDGGLAQYYKKAGRDDYINEKGVGKFLHYCEESGFGDDEIKDELSQADAGDCSLIEFDMDDKEVNHFPFSNKVKAEAAQQKEIQRILNDIAKYGLFKRVVSAMDLNIDMCEDITEKEVEKYSLQYTAQIGSLDKKQDKDLKFYLAVGLKQDFPFLTYFVDAFTKDKASKHAEAKRKNKKALDLTVSTWTKKNKYFAALKRTYSAKESRLVSAMTSYSHRIMARLQFTPNYKISDSMREIVEYLVSVPQFISNKNLTPPFQVDLLIAVKKVIDVRDANADTNASDNDDAESSCDEEKEVDPSIDHIGSLLPALEKLSLAHTQSVTADTDNKMEERVGVIQRNIGEKYGEFTGKLSDKGKLSKMYPQRRRFCLFVDRRPNAKHDVLTIFEPPSGCSEMSADSVPEIGFEFLSKCVVPKGNGSHITANDRCCGQLATFMFNVDAADEMRCYIVWNGQTMRFHGDHIAQVLPNLFVEGEHGNKEYVAGGDPIKMGQQFDTFMEDRKFEAFCNALQQFESKAQA